MAEQGPQNPTSRRTGAGAEVGKIKRGILGEGGRGRDGIKEQTGSEVEEAGKGEAYVTPMGSIVQRGRWHRPSSEEVDR